MFDKYASDLLFLSPMITVIIGSLLLLIYEVFIKRPWSRAGFALLVLVSAFAVNVFLYSQDLYPKSGTGLYGQLYIDAFSALINCFILLLSIFAVLISFGQLKSEKINAVGEYYTLFLMSVVGAMVFNSAAEFITLFLGLEIMSMALYCLCGSALTLRCSSESALKYFLLGSFSSAFLLYGIALLYGLTGSTQFLMIAEVISGVNGTLLSVAIGLVLVGLLFKIAAAPFHFWAPDVYQGAPTSITLFMASVIKASAVVVCFRVLWLVFPDNKEVWEGAIWTLAALTMTIGNLTALRQRSIKRMLAYSSVAHAGYMMVGLLVADAAFGGAEGVMFYLVAYSFVTLGSFAIVSAVSSPYLDSTHADDISRFNSLAKRQPILAILMALFMLSLAGIPPGMAGLLAKFFIFSSAVKAGFVGLAIIGMLNSAVSAYYYLRIIVAMYFMESKDGETYSKPAVTFPMYLAIGVCAFVVVVLGIFPSRIYDGAKNAIEPVMKNYKKQIAYFNENTINQ